jgi:hypothetical protein
LGALHAWEDARKPGRGGQVPKVPAELEECASRAAGGRPDAR